MYVRAKNGEIDSQWSAAGTGRTSIGNSEPVFNDRSSLTEANPSTTRTVAENTRPGQSVGRAVVAVDGNGDTRTYRLVAETAGDTASEAAVAKFDINESTGQILTKDPLNHEAECSAGDSGLTGGHTENCTYTVKVQVWDGLDEDRDEEDTSTITDDIIDDTITVNIMVSDVAERPLAPTVTVTSSAVDDGVTQATLTVTWDMPENTGPAITGYVVECTGDGITATNPCPQPTSPSLTDAAVSYEIPSLTPNKPYRVRVRADNAEGQGAWSTWVSQSTSKEGNTLPSFPGTTPNALFVTENAPPAREPLRATSSTGDVVTIVATDSVGDSVTYRLEGPGAGRFAIDGNGQITTTSKLNHEDPECGYDSADEAATTSCSYNVRVKASDRNGGSVVHNLTITVTDAEEAPEAPATPRVTATAGSGWSLEVTWNEPRNTGPAITGYEIRYRKHGTTDCNDDDSPPNWCNWPHTGTARKATIETILDENNVQVHLEPETRYDVQVRALNGEGDLTFETASVWSSLGNGRTGASNRRPAFKDEDPVVTLQVEEKHAVGAECRQRHRGHGPGRP